MIVKDVMNTDVKTTDDDSSVQEAAKEMKKFRIGSLVVVDGTKMIGIVTERDIMDKVVSEASDPSKIKVKEVMTDEVIMVDPEKDLGEAAELMVDKKIKKLPVIKGNQLVGIVTAWDLCAAEPKLMEQIGELTLIQKKKAIAG